VVEKLITLKLTVVQTSRLEELITTRET